jgi:hypothetical protein
MLYDARAFWAELRALPAGQRFQHLRASYGTNRGWLRELLLFVALACFTIAAAMYMTSGPAWLFLLLTAALVVTQSHTAVRGLDAAELGLRALMGQTQVSPVQVQAQVPRQYGHNDTFVRVDPIAPTIPIATPQREVIVTTVAEEVERVATALVTPPPPPTAPQPQVRVARPASDVAFGKTQPMVLEIRSQVIGAERPHHTTLKQVLVPMPARTS